MNARPLRSIQPHPSIAHPAGFKNGERLTTGAEPPSHYVVAALGDHDRVAAFEREPRLALRRAARSGTTFTGSGGRRRHRRRRRSPRRRSDFEALAGRRPAVSPAVEPRSIEARVPLATESRVRGRATGSPSSMNEKASTARAKAEQADPGGGGERLSPSYCAAARRTRPCPARRAQKTRRATVAGVRRDRPARGRYSQHRRRGRRCCWRSCSMICM